MDTTNNNMSVKWKPMNWVSTYAFSNPKKMGPLTKQFIKYVKSADEYSMKATKRGFYKIIGKELHPGNNSNFFASIKDAGIVKLNKEWNGSYNEYWYTKGSNWNAFLNGNLKRG
jgi:hypothetical protein